MYLVLVVTLGFLNWMTTYANDSEISKIEKESKLEERLAEALKPVADPEPKLESWLLTLSENILGE